MLKTVDDVIEALGGTGAAATLVGIGAPAVSMWRAAGKIPSDNYLVICQALKTRKKRVDPSVFGFREPA